MTEGKISVLSYSPFTRFQGSSTRAPIFPPYSSNYECILVTRNRVNADHDISVNGSEVMQGKLCAGDDHMGRLKGRACSGARKVKASLLRFRGHQEGGSSDTILYTFHSGQLCT
jgi:hypothetical protein